MKTNKIRTNQSPTCKLLFGAITLLVAIATVAQSAEITVDTASDEAGAAGMTLRKAIAQAQATPDDDTIVFADGISAIHLAQGKLWLGNLFRPPNSGSLRINGGAGGVTIDAGGQSSVMSIESGTVTLTDLKFTNGNASLGGGIMIWDPATVMLENSLVSNNYAANGGGGIYCAGVLVMSNTIVEYNESRDTGGGVHVYGGFGGSFAAINSNISDNAARAAGGGLFNEGANVMLSDPIVEYNTASNGGGIYNYGGSLEISSGDFTGNQTSRNGKGGDIYYTAGSFDPTGYDGLDLYEEKPKGKGGRK
jgi:fibronectin-binding autotransporter adhesin